MTPTITAEVEQLLERQRGLLAAITAAVRRRYRVGLSGVAVVALLGLGLVSRCDGRRQAALQTRIAARDTALARDSVTIAALRGRVAVLTAAYADSAAAARQAIATWRTVAARAAAVAPERAAAAPRSPARRSGHGAPVPADRDALAGLLPPEPKPPPASGADPLGLLRAGDALARACTGTLSACDALRFSYDSLVAVQARRDAEQTAQRLDVAALAPSRAQRLWHDGKVAGVTALVVCALAGCWR